MRYDLLQWLIGTDITLAILLFAATAMLRKRVTARRIRDIATSCVDRIVAAISASGVTEAAKHNSEQDVRRIIHKAKPTFSCFSDVSLFLLSVSFWTFSAFVSHSIAAIVFRYLNPTVNEGFVYAVTFVCAVLYFLNALVFLLGHGTWALLFSYVTLKEVNSD